MNCKKFLKYAGKTAVTIACPPLGLALWAKRVNWPKRVDNQVIAASVGLIFSTFVSLFSLNSKSLYNNPQVIVGKYPRSFLRGIPEALISPIAFYFDTCYGTSLEKDKAYYSVVGNDVITFNNEKYQLNFGHERVFCISGSPYVPGVSVAQAQGKVEKYEKLLDNYRQKGDTFSARRAEESLDKSKASLENTTLSYNTTKAEFQAVVDGMNGELETLAQTKESWEL